MAINLPQLKTELQTDPSSLGYAPLRTAGSTQALADVINLPRVTITVRRNDLSPSEVLEAIDNRDFVATPNAAHVAWFQSVTQLERLRLVNDDGTDTRVLGDLRRLLDPTDTQGSRARLATIANRNGSRAEQLFGFGTIISSNDVAAALALP